MNNEALNYAYSLFQKDGYTGTIENFSALMSTNQRAFDHAFSLFKKDGYKHGELQFRNLLEGKIAHATTDHLQDYRWHSAEKDISKTLNTIYNKQGFEVKHAKGMQDAITIHNKSTGETSEVFTIPSGLQEGAKGLLEGLGADVAGLGDLQDQKFQQLHKDIISWIEGSRNKETTEDGKLLKEQYEMSPHSMEEAVGEDFDIFSNDIKGTSQLIANDVLRGDDGSLHGIFEIGAGRLKGKQTKLTTKEVVNLTTDITEQTRLLLQNLDNTKHPAGMELTVLGGVKEFFSQVQESGKDIDIATKFKQLQKHERTRIGQAILTTINKKRLNNGEDLISWTNFNKIFDDSLDGNGVLDSVIGKMKNEQDTRIARSGLDPNNADPKLVEQENKKIYDTKSAAKQYKIDRMYEIQTLTGEIKKLNTSSRTAPSEKQDSIRKQISDKLGQIENKYYEITAKGAESGDDSLDGYFTKREEDNGVVYTEDRKDFMNQIFKETKLSIEEFISLEQSKYDNSITKREALQNLLQSGYLEKQNLIQSSQNQFVTVNVDKLSKGLRAYEEALAPTEIKSKASDIRSFIREARKHGYVDKDGDARISVAKMYTDFGLGGNKFDSWYDPMKGAMSDENIEMLKHFKREMDTVDAKNLALYDLGVLDQDPESVDDIYDGATGWALQAGNIVAKETLKIFGVDEHDADKIISVGKEHTNRFVMDQMQQVAHVHNRDYKEKIEKGEVEALEFDDEQVEAMTRSMSDNVAEGVGGFMPVLGQLGAITVATQGIGTIPAVARTINSLRTMRTAKGAWGTYANIQWHFGKLALEEAKMQIAGFKPGSGSAFYIGGLATSGVRLGGKIKWLDPLFQKVFKAPIVGAGSMELAQVTELGWEHLKGEVDYKREMNDLYGDMDEVQQRLITNALVFGIMGGPKIKGIRSEGKWYDPTSWRVGTDFMSTETKGRTVAAIRGKMNDILIEKGAKVDKAGNIKNKEKWIEKLEGKEKDKYNSYENTLGDIGKLFVVESYYRDLDVTTKKGQEAFTRRIVDPINDMIKSLDRGLPGIQVRFSENRNEFTLVEGKDGKLVDGEASAEWMAGKKGQRDTILIDPNKFTPGKMTHEVTHALLRSAFSNNAKYNNFVGKLREVFSDHGFVVAHDDQGAPIFRTGEQVAKAVKEKGAITGKKLDYRKSKDRAIGNEEFLAYFAEFLTAPEMYTQYVAPSFLKEVKAEVKDFLQNNFGYNAKIQTPEDLMTVFAGFGRAIRHGDRASIKSKGKQISNFFANEMNFQGIEVIVAQQGGSKKVKAQSKQLFQTEINKIEAKEKKEVLQEELKQAQDKFIKAKAGLDPIRDKEQIANIRNKFQETQRAIRDQIVDQNAVISGRRDYAKEISDFREKNKGNPKAINRFIAKINAEVSENMSQVRGIENVQRLWNDRNKLIKQRDVTYPNQLLEGKINKREYDNKISDTNKKLAEINKSVDWKTWSKLAGDLMIVNAGKIENVAQKAYELGANYGSGRIGKSELKTALDAQFLEVVADYNFKNPKGLAEFGAYMNKSLPTKIGAAYKMEMEGGKPKWAQKVGIEKAENIVDTGTPVGETVLYTKTPKKEKVKLSKREKELNSILTLETEGGKALDKIKIDPVAQREINKKLKPEGIINSESMYEAALNKYKKETIDNIPIKKGGKRRYTDKQAEELAKTTTWDNVNSAVIQDLIPQVTNAMIGITPKKGNITPGSIKNGQDFVDANAREILKIMKWNSAITPGKGIPERMVASSMNLPKKWLDTFYHEPSIVELKELGFRVSEKTGRVETPAGPRPKVLNENITIEQIKEFVGIKPDGTRIVDRNLSSTIKGLPVILGKAVNNQLIRKALKNGSVELAVEYKAKDVINRMENGIPPRLASRDLFAGVGKKFGITSEQAQRNVIAWVYGEKKGIPKEQLEFLEKLDKKSTGFKDAIMELHDNIVEAYKTTHVITSAKGAVTHHTGNTILTPEYKVGIERIAKSLGLPKEKYNKLLTEAAEKTTTGIWSEHTDKVTGEKIKVMDKEAVALINKFAGEYVKLLPKEIGVTLAMNLSGSPLSGRTGKGTFVKAFSKHFNMVEMYKDMYKKQGMKTKEAQKEAEKQARKDASAIVDKWNKGEKIESEYKEYLDNVKGKTGLFIKNKKGEIVELDYKDPLLTDFKKNIEKNLGKNTHKAFEGLDVSNLKTGSQLANAYKKAREFAEQGDMPAAEAALAKAFTALDMKTKEGMYQATGVAMEQLILNAKKGNSKDISDRLQYVFKIAKNNTSLTEGERVFTSNRFVRMVEGEGTGSRDPMIKDLMKEGLSLEKATEKVKGKVEHSKTSLNASYEKAFAVVSGRWGAEGKKIARDYIGIFSSVGKLDIIDNLGTRTSAARLSRMVKDRSELKNYKEFIDGKFTGRTLEDVLMEQVTKDLQALGAKVSIKSVKENHLTDAVNNYIAEPTSASVVNIKQTIKNKESVKKVNAYNRKTAVKSGLPISKKATNSEVLASAKLFDLAINEGRKQNKSKRGISVWDFDDTLARTKSGVHAKIPNPEGAPKPGKKVIFLAGGAGSGKSNVVKQLGLEKQGFKVVNSDISLEWLKKNHGLPENMKDLTPKQLSQLGKLQWEARKIAARKQMKFQGRGDGIVVDGTGGSMKVMEKQVKEFQGKGYDVQMLFVETSLETALARNAARKERTLKEIIVKKNHEAVQNNKEGFRKLFGNNFAEVKTDNLKIGDKMPLEVVSKLDAFTKGYEKRRLTAEEFAMEGKEILDKGGEFDFKEFDVVTGGEKGPFFTKAMDRIKKFGNKHNYILTARPPASAPHIREFLKSQGMDIPLENITGLGNSTAQAKAMWMLKKFSEGYNDFYFADDAIKNVKAVKDILSQLDVKSKVQQTLASKDLFSKINEITEHSLGIEAGKKFTRAEGKVRGKDIKRRRFFMTDSAADLELLIEPLYGKGKQGIKNKEWFREEFVKPFERGINDYNKARQTAKNDYIGLRKQNKDIVKKLNKAVEGTNFTFDQAMRVYLWNKAGYKIPDLAKTTENKLVEAVKADPKLVAYAEAFARITKQEKGLKEPSAEWWGETLAGEITNIGRGVSRKQYLQDWIDIKSEIFSEANLNKMESKLGTRWRENIEDMFDRMETGRTRSLKMDRGSAMMMNYLNGSVGTIMNFNTRSAALQTISTLNFLNMRENNPVAAAKAMANAPQFAKDFMKIMNSGMLKQRRDGLEINVTEAELASAAASSKNPIQAMIAKVLKVGYLPTKLADSFAISFGGATFYRNRIKMYEKQGMSTKEAEAKAWMDFQMLSERTQQSSRPDLLSRQQTSLIGRFVLPFANTPMQMNRAGIKDILDLSKGRYKNKVEAAEKMGRISYYMGAQVALFAGLQSALFAMMFNDEDVSEEKIQKTKAYTANTIADSFLRGMGVSGAIASGFKNAVLAFMKESDKDWNADYSEVGEALLNISPPIGSKFGKLDAAGNTWKYNKEVPLKFELGNPKLEASLLTIEAITNAPLHRWHKKSDNIMHSLNTDYENWQRALMLSGYTPWNVGIEFEKKKKKKKKKKKSKLPIPY